MSLAEVTAGHTVLRRVTPLDRTVGVYRPLVYLACTVLALVVNYAAGKEMAWDTLNYHLYSGFSVVHDRFSQDYFAAGPQSYGNPYAYVPFYALVSSGLSALQVASVLAILHSVILWLTFELALVVLPSGGSVARTAFAACAVALAAANPILLQQVGSSFADITTAELVLGGWLLLAIAARKPSSAGVVCGALLLGAATALKPTNAVHAAAAGVVVLMLSSPLSARLRLATLYTAAAGLAFAAVAAPWAYRLQQRFGNPFFPLLNNIFRSPEFTTEPLKHFRFVPSSLAEALWRPFAMLDPVAMIHEELRSPDLRYAVLLVLLCVLAGQWGWKRVARPQEPAAPLGPLPDTRVLAVLGCALAVDWAAWLKVSGNGRYFLSMGCVSAVVLAGLLWHVFAARPKLRNYGIVAMFALQSVQLCMGTDYRWHGVPWDGGPWFEVQVPQALAVEPNLYLSMGAQSSSYLAPYLASGAGLIDLASSYPLGAVAANRAKVQSLLTRYGTHVRLLARGERLYADEERRSPRVSEVDSTLGLFGLRADANDCARITVRGLPPERELTVGSAAPSSSTPTDTTYLTSCAVMRDDTALSADIARQRSADIVFDRLEDSCPELFQPRRVPTDLRGTVARRIYVNTDLVAWVNDGWVRFVDPTRGDNEVNLGRASAWERAPLRLACGRRNGHYFAKVLASRESP